ncbi:hypothetical protein P7K49_032663, partial [Saguinus oedipus]
TCVWGTPGKGGVHWAASTLRLGVGQRRSRTSSVYGSRRATDPRVQDLGHAELGPEDPEEEHPPEERAGEELPETLDPKDALYELERALDQDAEEDIPEMR